jgi:hypothetical protein
MATTKSLIRSTKVRITYNYIKGVTMGNKPFELVWDSQNRSVRHVTGRYATIGDASADRSNAQERLSAHHPAAVDFHYPHDIAAGTWRVVPSA